MLRVKAYENIDACRQLWNKHWPHTCIFDLWPVRASFQTQFGNRPYFLVAERNGHAQGMLALSWIEEKQCFFHFPGELWQGKTWLEQNKIPATDADVFYELLAHIPGPASIRYLTGEHSFLDKHAMVVDEIGYLFFPKKYNYSFETYMQQFSGKSRKKLGRELDLLKSFGWSFRHDCIDDVALMFRMNQEAFGEWSYFRDTRFRKSFGNLLTWFYNNGLLRITAVLLGGKVAAVDVGVIWDECYTILAGGTHPDFPGVAKLINFHHLEWACLRRFKKVDFLCGNFGWKERFHLAPRPLFKMQRFSTVEAQPETCVQQRIACVQ